MNDPRPEHRLLVLTMVPVDGSARVTAAIGSLCETHLDWDYVLAAAERMRMVPLLGAALRESAATVPPAVEAHCHRARLASVMRTMVAQRRLRDLRGALDAAGVRHLVLKGLPLAFELYPDPALRPSTDIDILVRRDERDAALSALAAEGYAPMGGSLSLRFFKAHHYHVALGRGVDLPVELHWDTQPFYSFSRIPEEGLWERSREVAIGDTRVRVPGREENLLYLVQHLSRHALGLDDAATDPIATLLDASGQGRLLWVTDLLRLEARRPPMDEPRIAGLAKRWGLARDLRAARRLQQRIEALRNGDGDPVVSPGSGGVVSGAKRAARRFPFLGRTSTTLHLRPVLLIDALRSAFPGSASIRARYELHDAPALMVGLRAVYHPFWIAWRLARMLGAALALVALQAALSARRLLRQRRVLSV